MTPTSNKKPALTFIVKSVHRRRHPSIHLHQLRHARTPTGVTHPPQGTALIHEPTREETCHGVMPRTAVAHSASQHKAWELRLARGGREPPKKKNGIHPKCNRVGRSVPLFSCGAHGLGVGHECDSAPSSPSPVHSLGQVTETRASCRNTGSCRLTIRAPRMSNPRGARGRGSIHPVSPQELHVGRGSADSTWKGGRPLELPEASLACTLSRTRSVWEVCIDNRK